MSPPASELETESVKWRACQPTSKRPENPLANASAEPSTNCVERETVRNAPLRALSSERYVYVALSDLLASNESESDGDNSKYRKLVPSRESVADDPSGVLCRSENVADRDGVSVRSESESLFDNCAVASRHVEDVPTDESVVGVTW